MLSLTLAMALAASPPLVIATQQPDASSAQVGIASAGGFRALAEVSTEPGATPKGAVSPDGSWAALVTIESRHHDGTLYALDLDRGALKILDEQVLGLERPRFTRDGSAVYVKLVRSEEPPPMLMRQGALALTTTEIWSASRVGDRRLLARIDAYGVNLAGLWRDQVLLYRVDESGASIWRVGAVGGEPVELARLPNGPFARDFNVVGDSLVYATLLDPSTHTFGVQRLDLDHGTVETIARDASDHLAPFDDAGSLLVTRAELETLDGHRRLAARAFALARTRNGTLAMRVEQADRELLGWLTRDGQLVPVPTLPLFELFGPLEPRR